MIIPLPTPADVSLGSYDSWQDISVSSLAGYSSAVTGVIVDVVDTGTSNRAFGLRKNGSTDARIGLIIGQVNGTHLMAYVGVDSSGIFEGYADDSDLDFYVVALVTEDTFLTNSVDKSTGSTSSWVDLDISSDTGGTTATYAWFEWSSAALWVQAFRKNGSTDDRRAQSPGTHGWAGCGLDGSEICEQYISNSGQDALLVGYGNTSMTWHTNAIDRSTGTTGSYQTVTAPTTFAVAAIYDAYTSGASALRYALRRVGDTADRYQTMYLRSHSTTALSNAGTAEQKVSSTSADLYELGYWVSRWAFRASSFTTTAGATSTTIAIAKATGLAANDLEITAILGENDAATIAAPSGYTAIGPATNTGSGRLYLFIRKAAGGESSTQTFTCSASTYLSGCTWAYTGLGSDTEAVDASQGASGDSDVGPYDLTAATSTVPDTLGLAVLVAFGSSGAGVTLAGFQTIQGIHDGIVCADGPFGYIGASAAAAFNNLGTVNWVGLTVAIRAEAAGGPAATRGKAKWMAALGVA